MTLEEMRKIAESRRQPAITEKVEAQLSTADIAFYGLADITYDALLDVAEVTKTILSYPKWVCIDENVNQLKEALKKLEGL